MIAQQQGLLRKCLKRFLSTAAPKIGWAYTESRLSDEFNKQFEGASQNMTAEESGEYAEMKKLLDDPEICRIAQPVFRYLKATLLIRKNNVDCSVKYTNSGGYTNEEPRYVYHGVSPKYCSTVLK
jgi:hypothetical protein